MDIVLDIVATITIIAFCTLIIAMSIVKDEYEKWRDENNDEFDNRDDDRNIDR